jgi:flagellar hook-associated protein 2
VQTLQSLSTFQANTATSSNTAAFTATADGTSVPNSYQVGVTQLAKAAQMSSSFYSNASALVGAGSLSLNLGTAYVNGATLSSSAPPLTSTDMGINGYPITAVITPGNTPQQNVIASINASTGSTGVIAVDNGSGGISLSNSLSTNTAAISITGNPATVLAETGLTTGTTTAAHQAFTVNTDATTTLSSLVSAINNASGNPGITASIINVDAGAQLLLTSNTMGAANTIGVQATPSSGSNLSSLNTLTTVQAPSNAIITLNGQQVTRQSNSFSDVVPGVTFSLTAPTTSTASLAIAANPATATSNVNSFITAYNSLVGTMNNLSNYNATTGTASQLFGDPMMMGIKNQLLHALNASISGISGFSTLAEIGVTPDHSGALSLNSVVFNQAMAANPTGVANLFASSTGIAAQFDVVLNNQLGFTGTIATRVNSDNTQLTSIANQQTTFNAQMSALQAQYLKQFNAMDSIVGNLQNTSNSLTSMLANLPGFNGTTNIPANTKIG